MKHPVRFNCRELAHRMPPPTQGDSRMATKKGKSGGLALCIDALCLRRTKAGARLCEVHLKQRRELKGRT